MSGSGEMEAMAARECVECGSTELAKNDEGHLVCDDCGVMCGTVEELTEDAETYDRGDGGGVNYSALRLKRVKGTGKGGKAGSRKDHDQHDRVRPPTWLETVLAFQGWLKALVSALVEHKNLSPQLDEYVSTLFHDYIQAADRGATSERWPSMSLKDKDAGRVMLSAQLALTFLYIGCLFLREAVTINDLLAWARSTSDSPFMGYWRTLPPLTREGSSIRPGRLPIASGLHKFSVNVVHLLKLDVPPVNFPLLSARFVRLLRLPPPVLPAAVRLHTLHAVSGSSMAECATTGNPPQAVVMAYTLLAHTLLANLPQHGHDQADRPQHGHDRSAEGHDSARPPQHGHDRQQDRANRPQDGQDRDEMQGEAQGGASPKKEALHLHLTVPEDRLAWSAEEARDLMGGGRDADAVGKILSLTMYLLNTFSQVISPTNPSTYCLLFLVIKLSWRVCGWTDFRETI